MKIFLSIVITLICTFNLYSQPKLVIESGDTVNWGKVKPIQSPLKTRIILKNIGKDTLIILNVKPGCGCTNSKLSNKVVPPDSSSFVEIEFNLPNIPGPTHKIVTIKSTDYENAERIVNLLADIVFPIISIPQTQMITLDNLTTGKESKGSIILINTTDEDIIIKDVKTSPENLKTNLKNDMVLKPQKEFKIDISLIPLKPGFFNGSIKFKTTYEDVPRFEIPVRGNVLFNPSDSNPKSKTP